MCKLHAMPIRFQTDGDSCHRHRVLAGFSALAAGRAASVTGQHIRNIERGLSEASPSLARRLADLYGCDISDLLREVREDVA